jgi:hypothetical protein
LPAPELLELLEEIRRAQRIQDVRLTRLIRQTEREPVLRRLTAIERALNLVEKPQAPRHTRRRPLGLNKR